jgi:hypothetical protein
MRNCVEKQSVGQIPGYDGSNDSGTVTTAILGIRKIIKGNNNDVFIRCALKICRIKGPNP